MRPVDGSSFYPQPQPYVSEKGFYPGPFLSLLSFSLNSFFRARYSTSFTSHFP
jgi:hypothetical protein